MKKQLLILFIIFIPTITFSQSYYWYQNRKIPITQLTTKRFVLINASDQSNFTQSLQKSNVKSKAVNNLCMSSKIKPYKGGTYNNYKWTTVQTGDAMAMASNPYIVYSAPYFKTSDGNEVGLSHLFYVKLKRTSDFQTLVNMANTYKVKIIGNNKYMPLWYTLMCNNESSGNALQVANIFYETNKFEACEADLMSDDILCVNDPQFTNQWNLQNTGQNGGVIGIDINYCNARSITQGSINIIVAVVDQGIDLKSSEINIHPLSFDTESGTSPSQVFGSHGINCAGIISARANNNKGIAGIAPNCRVMSISNSLSGTPDSRQKRADGINFARLNGASVISNSWSSAVQYQIIDDAIRNALTLGRSGKGCVVVFASGNDARQVSYPANVNPDILAVGSISRNGKRSSFSNYGSALDIVAPGEDIITTFSNNTIGTTSGTSFSCPTVAAVAALVLSINPNLTQKEVANIIETTARKVPGYSFATISGRPNGTWNNEMGYGLLDAYTAVMKASNGNCQTTDYSNKTVNTTTTVTCNNITSSNVTVSNGATLILKGSQSVILNPPFTVNTGSKLELNND